MSDFSPILFCFIGPGASGKSTICQSLVESDLPVHLSVSSTTRAPRGGEQEGVEYFFKSKPDFEKSVRAGGFLEFAEFAGNYYGTEIGNLERARKERKHLVLDIEINGVRILKKSFGSQVVVSFVCPPTLGELRKRFELRGSDSKERIDERMRIAEYEVKEGLQPGVSDYLIINENLDQTVKAAKAIILAEQIKCSRLEFTP